MNQTIKAGKSRMKRLYGSTVYTWEKTPITALRPVVRAGVVKVGE